MWCGSGGQEIVSGGVAGLMGIINITPDSFYDGGRFEQPEKALIHACELLSDGAHILDIGAESTRPGSSGVSWQEECRRLLPALRIIRKHLPGAILSVDTRNSRTAMKALQLGVQIINDVSAWERDPELFDVVLQFKPGYVLMHSKGSPETMQKDPHYCNIVDEVALFFEKKMNMLVAAGLPEDRIILDPGIGFGKNTEHNMALCKAAPRFAKFGRPLLIGISNKSILGQLFGQGVQERTFSTSILVAGLAQAGYAWHRVHNVKEARKALEGAWPGDSHTISQSRSYPI